MKAREPIDIETPVTPDVLKSLHTGYRVRISGIFYTARDAAHKRMEEAVRRGKELPFDPTGQLLFYVGPTPTPPGRVIGSAGPTTASRMDFFTPLLIERGLRGMIGKGRRSRRVRETALKHGCVYFGSVEGTAVILAERIRFAEVVAYEDLGAEAIYRLKVENFPAIVVNDLHGGDLYDEGQNRYRRSWPP